MEQNFFFYKNQPVVRSGDFLYCGYMSEPYVVYLKILQKDTSGVFPIAKEIQVYCLSTDKNKSLRTTKCTSLYEALDLAAVWLSRGLPKKPAAQQQA